jgi:hypothetical protein
MAAELQDVRECIARLEFDEIRGAAFYNRTWIVSHRYCNVGDGVDSLEGYLHSLWHMYYQLARHAAHESTDQDRLVLHIVRIQGLGPLTRPVTGNYGIDIARTVDGTLWNDLPFLATDMTEFWIDNCAAISGVQRLNFASFLAKLAATRVSKDRICQTALVLFRSALETRQVLSEPEQLDHADTHRHLSMLNLTHLMPSICAWIKEAGHVLVQLSELSWNDCPSTIGQGGTNFIESEFGARSPMGFTPWRWMYWLKRLHEIRDEAKEASEKKLEDYAIEAIDRMTRQVKDRNSGILRAYQNGGEALHKDEHLVCLKDLKEW